MDTRIKIVDVGTIPRDGRPCTVVVGYFDPLYSEHVTRLQDLSRTGEICVVAIDDPPTPLLPWRARAELVAALGSVDYVIPAGAVSELAVSHMIDQRQADLRSTGALIELVVAKHRSA